MVIFAFICHINISAVRMYARLQISSGRCFFSKCRPFVIGQIYDAQFLGTVSKIDNMRRVSMKTNIRIRDRFSGAEIVSNLFPDAVTSRQIIDVHLVSVRSAVSEQIDHTLVHPYHAAVCSHGKIPGLFPGLCTGIIIFHPQLISAASVHHRNSSVFSGNRRTIRHFSSADLTAQHNASTGTILIDRQLIRSSSIIIVNQIQSIPSRFHIKIAERL